VPNEFFYEYRKDLIVYLLALTVIHFARRWDRPVAAARNSTPEPGAPHVRLEDGSRSVDVDISELVAIVGGGNYVELIHRGDRRQLLRSTMASAEAALVDHGFRRTHKSWLVRLSSVSKIERTSAGDYRLSLGSDLVAPLSRRSSEVVKEVRRSLDRSKRLSPPHSQFEAAAS
jgi:DNA-binding LytR/AlgR family response regulator